MIIMIHNSLLVSKKKAPQNLYSNGGAKLLFFFKFVLLNLIH